MSLGQAEASRLSPRQIELALSHPASIPLDLVAPARTARLRAFSPVAQRRCSSFRTRISRRGDRALLPEDKKRERAAKAFSSRRSRAVRSAAIRQSLREMRALDWPASVKISQRARELQDAVIAAGREPQPIGGVAQEAQARIVRLRDLLDDIG